MAKWSDDEIYEYYKTGKKPTGVTDQNYELGLNNYLKTEKSNLLDSNLAQQQSSLVKQQTNAQQSASISNASLQRYLGKSSLASGAATGQVGTNFVNANNAYQQNRAAINSDFSAQNQALLQKYLDNKTQIQEDFSTKQTGILDKYYGRSRDALADSRYEDELAYNRSRDALSDTRYADETTYNRDLDAYRKLIEEDERKYGRGRDAISDSRYADETAYAKERDAILDARYANEMTVTDQNILYQEMMTDLRDGYFDNDEDFKAELERLKPYLAEWQYKGLLGWNVYLRPSESKTTAETEQETADNWTDYRATFKGNEYTGSEPKITNNGYLTVKADGKQMYAYKEVASADIQGQGMSRWNYLWAALLGPTGVAIIESNDPARKEKVEKWLGAAQAGGLPDGAVIDTVAGGKNYHIMYYKGKFYEVGDNASKAIGGFK